MTRSACLIFNPIAGQGNPDEDLTTIRAILEPEFSLTIEFTDKDVSAGDLARQAIRQGAETIIASGGDETLSEVATALVGSNIPLGIISRGTANAFANALDLPNSIEGACQTILQGNTRVVDTASCNGLPMVLLAGIGFEAETVERADRQAKKRFGVLAYILAGFQQLRNLKAFRVEIETESKIIKTAASAVTIANVAPATSVLAQGPAEVVIDDGLLDLTIVAPTSVAGAIAATYHLLQTAFSGDPAQRDDIGYLRANYFKIKTNPPQKVVLDGEMIGQTPIEIQCIPSSLMVFVPKADEEDPVEKLEGLPELVVSVKEETAEIG
jgi:YegS/Rv2252/BmrU family lipid kinase